MTPNQEPKYEARGGRIFNRATGEAIPDDEPVFILRARDTTALAVLVAYHSDHLLCGNSEHAAAVLKRVKDFQRFMREHSDRMKYPDTEA